MKPFKGKVIFKGIMIIMIVLSFFFFQILISILPAKFLWRMRMFVNKLYANITLRALNIRTRIIGNIPPEPAFLVANHLSWIDPMILTAISPARFVTSNQTKKDWFLGSVTKLAGCFFVERNPFKLRKELSEMENKEDNCNIAFFPEATSGNAESVLPFKPAMFELALYQKKQVQPVVVNYQKVNDEKFNFNNRDTICYYGDMEFFPHLWGILNTDSIDVEIKFLEPVYPEGYHNRKDLCHQIYDDINLEVITI